MSQACGHLPSRGLSPGQVVDTKSGVEVSFVPQGYCNFVQLS